MPAPTFVTGGSGFVGDAILRRLVADGREVRALARSAEAAAAVEAAGARAVHGDLFDERALTEGMRNCDSVFHVAGVNAMCRRDPGAMLRTNIEGTSVAVRAAAAAGVGRVVHTSSAATVGEAEGVIGREDTPHRGRFLSSYERSKFLGEERALSLGRELGIDVVSVNPSSVQGPGRTGGSARLLLGLVDARLAFVVHTFVSVVDVDDCAAGHLLAERAGVPGRRYLLNGASLTARAAVALVRSVAGRPRRVVRLPRAVATLAGAATGWAGHAIGRDPPFCSEMARTLLHGHRYDGSLAARELGLVYRPIEETVTRTLRWYERQGLIRPLSRLMDVP
jgi:dihydroflavonol-4-reductase